MSLEKYFNATNNITELLTECNKISTIGKEKRKKILLFCVKKINEKFKKKLNIPYTKNKLHKLNDLTLQYFIKICNSNENYKDDIDYSNTPEILERLVLERQYEYDKQNTPNTPNTPPNNNKFTKLNGMVGLEPSTISTLPLSMENLCELEELINSPKNIIPLTEYELTDKLQKMQNDRSYTISDVNKQAIYICDIDPNILLKMSSDDINEYIKNNYNTPVVVTKEEIIDMLLELKQKLNKNIVVKFNVKDIVKDPADYNDYLYELPNKLTNITAMQFTDCIFPNNMANSYYMYFSNISEKPCLEIQNNGTYKQIGLDNIKINELSDLIIQFKDKDNNLINFQGNEHVIHILFSI